MRPTGEPVPGARVMVVEDDPTLRRVFCRTLAKAGYPCREASTGEEALALLTEEPVDLVLSDVRLPGMNGCALIRAIAARWSQVRVLLISGYVNVELVDTGDCEDGMPLLSKPFSHAEFLGKVRAVLDRPPWRPRG